MSIKPFTLALLILLGCAARPPKISVLIKRLDNPNPAVQVKAANQLAARGPEAAPALPPLLVLFRSPQRPVYEAAAQAIRATGVEGSRALASALSDRDAWVRCRAAENLGVMGSSAAAAVPQLAAALRDKDFCVAEKSAEALALIGEPALPALITAMREENKPGRRGAAAAIARMDPAIRRRAVEELKAGWQNKDELERGEAFERLISLGKAALPILLEGLWDKNLDIRHRSLDAVEEIGEFAPGMVEALAGLFKDPQRTVRLRAAVILGNMGQKDPAVLPRILPLLSSPDQDIRQGAMDAIGNMGTAGAGATDQLIAIMEDGKDKLRDDAAEALMKIGTSEALRAAERHTRKAYPKRPGGE